MSLKKNLEETQAIVDVAMAQFKQEQMEREAAPLRSAVHLLMYAKASIFAEAKERIAKLDRVIESLEARIPKREQADTPKKTAARIAGAVKREVEARRRYPVSHAKEVKVNFPSWVKGGSGGNSGE